jgi:RNA polymerase sigma factor (sigma-70 family)
MSGPSTATPPLLRCPSPRTGPTRENLEASALQHAARAPALAGRSPLLRLQNDERLIALIRRGHHGAFEALVHRYQPRLLAFCRHMLGSQEDAEDVLQDVFAASFNAICADERPINARPWLYRIARNRCLNHLRRPQPAGQDSMDVFERDGGTTTADTVHKREEFRHIVADVHELPETQRSALLLRELDALSYDQIAEAMDTTVPSVKSLLVRARVSLAEAAEARLLTCEEVRLELGQVAEGLAKASPPARRHLRSCARCRAFRGQLRTTTKALAAVYPVGPLILLKKLWLAKLGFGAASGGAAASSGGVAGGAGVAGTAATAASGISAGSAVSAGAGAIASKAAAGMAAAAIVTAGAVEVKHVARDHPVTQSSAVTAQAPAVPAKPPALPAAPTRDKPAQKPKDAARTSKADAPTPATPMTDRPAPTPPPTDTEAVQEDSGTVILPPRDEAVTRTEPTPPPGESTTTPAPPPPAPVAGEPQPQPTAPAAQKPRRRYKPHRR